MQRLGFSLQLPSLISARQRHLRLTRTPYPYRFMQAHQALLMLPSGP